MTSFTCFQICIISTNNYMCIYYNLLPYIFIKLHSRLYSKIITIISGTNKMLTFFQVFIAINFMKNFKK